MTGINAPFPPIIKACHDLDRKALSLYQRFALRGGLQGPGGGRAQLLLGGFSCTLKGQHRQRRFRENTRPARPKTAYFAHFGLAGRTFSRTRRDNMATLKPTTPLLTPNKGALKPPSPLRPKNALNTPISHLQRRWRFQTTGPPGPQGLAAVPVGGADTTASQISHVIYRGHFSRSSKNVAIPTM